MSKYIFNINDERAIELDNGINILDEDKMITLNDSDFNNFCNKIENILT